MRVSRPGTRSGSRRSQSATTSSGVAPGPILAPSGLMTPTGIEVGAVELAGAFADPEHVGRAVEPVAGERVPAGQRLLVAEDERLVAGQEVDLVQASSAARSIPQAAMNRSARSISAAIARSGGPRAGRHELLVPRVHLGQVGEAALREGPQQVEGRRRLVVGGDEPLGVGAAGSASKASSLTMWPGTTRALVARPSRWRSAGLGELAGDAAHLDHRDPGRRR